MSVIEFVVSVMCSCQTTNVSVVVGPINPVTACPKLCDAARGACALVCSVMRVDTQLWSFLTLMITSELNNNVLFPLWLQVDDISAVIADLKTKNIRMLSAEPRIGAHGKPVMFLHPKDCDGVLVELEEAWNITSCCWLRVFQAVWWSEW